MKINGKLYFDCKGIERHYEKGKLAPCDITSKYYLFLRDYREYLESLYDFKMHDAFFVDANKLPCLSQYGLELSDEEQSDLFYSWCETTFECWEEDMRTLGICNTFHQLGHTSSHYAHKYVSYAMHNGSVDAYELLWCITDCWLQDMFAGFCDQNELEDAMYLLDLWIDNTKKLIDLYLLYYSTQVESFEMFIENYVVEVIYPDGVYLDNGHGKTLYKEVA